MKTDKSADSWIDYWDSDRIFSPVMKKIARYFIRQTQPLLDYNKKDIVLDFGCGPGYLEEELADKVGEIHGLDTSGRMISECRKKFEEKEHIHFHLLKPDAYTDLSSVGNIKFTIIVCLSVLQYFERLTDIRELILNIRQVAAPGARLLIADLPVDNNPVPDTLELLKVSLRERAFFSIFWFLIRSMTSKYPQLRASRGILKIPVSTFIELIEDLPVNPEMLSVPLTFNRRRVNFLIKFRSPEDSKC